MKAASADAPFMAASIGFSAEAISLADCMAYMILLAEPAPVYPVAEGVGPLAPAAAGGLSIDMALPIRPLAALGASASPSFLPADSEEMVLII